MLVFKNGRKALPPDTLEILILHLQSGLEYGLMRGSIAHWLAYLLPHPAARGLIPSIPPENSEEKIVDVAEVNKWGVLRGMRTVA